jgi:hypothetical protein
MAMEIRAAGVVESEGRGPHVSGSGWADGLTINDGPYGLARAARSIRV